LVTCNSKFPIVLYIDNKCTRVLEARSDVRASERWRSSEIEVEREREEQKREVRKKA
jgi:hypothetical protein